MAPVFLPADAGRLSALLIPDPRSPRVPSKIRFAIVRMWPEEPVAEHECVERIKLAAAQIGAEVAEIDQNGYLLDDPLHEITPSDFDFVIHTHFASAKVYDCFSYAALWNPLHFFFDWGYFEFAQNQASHDGFLTPGSRWIEDLVLREAGARVAREDFVPLHTTLLRPIHEPRIRTDKRLFYCGVNWERLGGAGRHHGLLSELDRTGLLAIYGPREVLGKPVWHGFRSYKGPLPFDGHSVVDTIHEHGVSLVLTSQAHKLSSIASSRLFESVAAGAVIVADRHDFVRDAFENCALYIDDIDDPSRAARQVAEHVAWTNAHPEAAADLATRAQEIFKSQFRLDDELRELSTRHERLVVKRSRLLLNRSDAIGVDLILPWYGEGTKLPEAYVRSLARIGYCNFRLHVVGDSLAEEDKQAIAEALSERASFHTVPTKRAGLRLPTGQLISEISSQLSGDVMIVSNGVERWFEDSIGRTVRPFEDNPQLCVTLGDYITRYVDADGVERRTYMSTRFGVVAEEAVAVLAVRRSAYQTLRHYCDYLDNGEWRDFLISAFRGSRLCKIGHYGLLIDTPTYAKLEVLQSQPLLDKKQQATLTAQYAVTLPYEPDHVAISQAVRLAVPDNMRRALRYMTPEERKDFASEIVQSLPLTGLQRQIVKWLWRPLRKRARAQLAKQKQSDAGRKR